MTASSAQSQRADSTRAGVAAPSADKRLSAADSTIKGKISPRRAFLGSLLAPGWMQLKMNRRKAATIFLVAEASTIGMSAKSWNDLHKAKLARKDTTQTPVFDSGNKPVIDQVTGLQKVDTVFKNPNLVGRIRARRTHLEDWIAGVIFTHLFAGADAYVAANLQDFDTNVQASATARSLTVMARVAW